MPYPRPPIPATTDYSTGHYGCLGLLLMAIAAICILLVVFTNGPRPPKCSAGYGDCWSHESEP